MSIVINTNVDSLRIQNVLANSTNKLANSMQRMSTGLKINSSKDDAAGSVISARMKVQLDGNQICQNNVQNASTLLSTAEGNVDVVLDNVQRIRDLTLEAKNGTYSAEEIKAMQDEVDQRINEIDRISQSAKYSQLQLFGSTDTNGLATAGAKFQVGANATTNDVIEADNSLFASVKFNDIVTKGIGDKNTDATAVETALLDKANNKIGGAAIAAANNNKVYYNTGDDKFYKVTYTAGANEGDDPTITYTEVTDVNRGYVADVDKKADLGTGVIGDIKKTTDDGKYYEYQLKTDKSGGEWKEIDSKTAIYSDSKKFNLTTMSKTDMDEALNGLDSAIDNLTDRKSQIGSLGNRLSSALDTLTTQYTNLSSANSVITDADIAAEASTYTQNQILQQVATSLLAQANQTPSIALSLI